MRKCVCRWVKGPFSIMYTHLFHRYGYIRKEAVKYITIVVSSQYLHGPEPILYINIQYLGQVFCLNDCFELTDLIASLNTCTNKLNKSKLSSHESCFSILCPSVRSLFNIINEYLS